MSGGEREALREAREEDRLELEKLEAVAEETEKAAKAVNLGVGGGSDLEQKVNGVIQYIPALSPGGKLPVLEVIEDGPPKA